MSPIGESGTIEAWAHAFVTADRWADKLAPPPPPTSFEAAPVPVRLDAPGRGPGFVVARTSEKSTGRSGLRSPARRAKLVHAFLHHELQAAELFAWALLAFPETPETFRRGLLGILLDEVRHIHLYAGYLRGHGVEPGDLPVRDWFWERVPLAVSPAAFCATMGMGFEAGNLDHAARFATRFRAAGDDEAAALEELVGREEIPHVMFATRWYARFTGVDAPAFDDWRRHLPAPLSPMVMRGDPVNRSARLRAGASAAFVADLERFVPDETGARAPASGA